jgi:hypothetical protein
MINNDTAWGLMQEVTNSIADVYGWPNFKPIERKRAVVDSQIFNTLSGSYSHENEEINIINQNGKLFIDLKNGFGRLIELHPESDNTYFLQEADVELKFFPSGDKLSMVDSSNQAVLYNKKK